MLFEANKGGIGLAGRIADTIEQLLAAALRRIVGCHCLTGCSSCIHLQNCGDYNEGLEKAAAVRPFLALVLALFCLLALLRSSSAHVC